MNSWQRAATVLFNEWYHYRLVLDFGTDSYRGYVNGMLVATTGFVDRGFGLDNFSDADISAFAASPDAVSQGLSASAVFDNFVIRDGLLGDYDIDGDVDTADYTKWRMTFGTAVSPAGNNADGNKNGVVDAARLRHLAKQSGRQPVFRCRLGISIVQFSGSGAIGTAVDSHGRSGPCWPCFGGGRADDPSSGQTQAHR